MRVSKLSIFGILSFIVFVGQLAFVQNLHAQQQQHAEDEQQRGLHHDDVDGALGPFDRAWYPSPLFNRSSSLLSGPMAADSINAKISNEDSFAACLLVSDDNHWLTEWLAYHYHVLPLEHLIVVRDPRSKTSIKSVLGRWKDRMHITEWTDDRFLPRWVKRKHATGNMSAVHLHRYRQQFLYAACLKEFRSQNKTWVLLTDTDEFVRPNPYRNDTATPASVAMHIPLSQRGSVLATLQQDRTQISNTSCVYIPRIQMATTEDSDPTVFLPTSLQGMNASHFLTTRWFHHNGHELTGPKNLNGKNVVQVAALKDTDIPRKVQNVHVVLPSCPSAGGDRLATSSLVIHHYAGTFEQYTFRNDPRDAVAGRPQRSDQAVYNQVGQESLEQQHRSADYKDTSIAAWLEGFVEAVGASEARRLLEGVGVVDYKYV